MAYNYGTSARSELEEFTTLFSGLFERQDLLIRQQAVRITTLETEIASLSDLHTLVTAHTSQIAINQSQITNNQSQITNNQSQISSLNTSLDNLDSGLSSTNGIISALDVKVETNKSDIQTLTTSTTNSITAINSTLQSNSTNLTQNNNKITALQSSTGANTASVVSLTTKSNQNATNITTLTTNISSLTATVSGHTTLLAGLRTDVDSGGGSQTDITNLQNDVSTINTSLTSLTATVSGFSSTISTIQTTVNTQADTILGVMNDVDTLGNTVSNFSSSIGSITTLTNNVNGLTASVSTISSRSFTNMQQISTLRTDTDANTTLTNNLLTSLQSFGTSLTAVQASITALEQGGSSSGLQTQIDTLRIDTDANTLQGSQLLTAIQYQSTTIFAIDQAIIIINGKVAVLETSQIAQDDLIRDFDQLFNEPVNGVVDKLNNLRNNVDDNNLILGTLSTHTTSLLTAMTIIYTRVQVLEDNAPVPPSNFDLFDEYPSTNYVGGGVIQTSFNITVEEALEIGLTISNLYSIVHNVGGTTYYCAAGGSLVSGQSINRTTFVKK